MRISFALLLLAAFAAGCADDVNDLAGVPAMQAPDAAVPDAAPAPPLDLSSEGAVDGIVGASFRRVLTASGGVEPLVWSSSNVPPGLAWSEEGPRTQVLSGVFTTPGVYPLEVQVTDDEGQSAEVAVSIEVFAPVGLGPGEFPSGTVNASYAGSVTASPGAGGHRFEAFGDLPPGLALETTGPTVELRGVPTSTGTFAFEIQVTDARGQSDRRGWSVTIEPPPLTIVAAATATVTGCRGFQIPLTAEGGAGAGYRWELAGDPDSAIVRGSATATLTAIVDEGQHALTVILTDADGDRTEWTIDVVAGPRDGRYVAATLGAPGDYETYVLDVCHRQPRVVRRFRDQRDARIVRVDFSPAPNRRWLYVRGAVVSSVESAYRVSLEDPSGPLVSYNDGFAFEAHFDGASGSYSFLSPADQQVWPVVSRETDVVYVPPGQSAPASRVRLFPDVDGRGETTVPPTLNASGDALAQRWSGGLLFATRTGTTWSPAGAVTWTDDLTAIGFDAEDRFLAVRDGALIAVTVTSGRPLDVRSMFSIDLFRPFLWGGGRYLIGRRPTDFGRMAVYEVAPAGFTYRGDWEGLDDCQRDNGFIEEGFYCFVTQTEPWTVRGWTLAAPTMPVETSLPTPDAFLSVTHAYAPGQHVVAEVSGQQVYAWTLGPTPQRYPLTERVPFIDPFMGVTRDRQRVVITGGELLDPELWIHDLSRLPEDSLLWNGPGDAVRSAWRPDGTGLLFARFVNGMGETRWVDLLFDETPAAVVLLPGFPGFNPER